MKPLSYLDFRVALEKLPALKIIRVTVFLPSSLSLQCDYTCSVSDALYLITNFTCDHLFTYNVI